MTHRLGRLDGGWDAVSFEAATEPPPEERMRLVGDLVGAFLLPIGPARCRGRHLYRSTTALVMSNTPRAWDTTR